jgi:hypothetical protein
MGGIQGEIVLPSLFSKAIELFADSFFLKNPFSPPSKSEVCGIARRRDGTRN